MSNILGIDEAGRGCILNAMVIIGIVARGVQQFELAEIGVKDSKDVGVGLSKVDKMRERADLASEIVRIVGPTGYFVKYVDAYTISKTDLNLNELERHAAQEVITDASIFHPRIIDEVVADGNLIFKSLDVSELKATLNAIDKADSLNVVVSAASVVAKTLRDAAVHKIMGDSFWNGAGYCNQGTKDWLLEDFEVRKYYCRQNWKWFKTIEEER